MSESTELRPRARAQKELDAHFLATAAKVAFAIAGLLWALVKAIDAIQIALRWLLCNLAVGWEQVRDGSSSSVCAAIWFVAAFQRLRVRPLSTASSAQALKSLIPVAPCKQTPIKPMGRKATNNKNKKPRNHSG
jgi:hypothetical protein